MLPDVSADMILLITHSKLRHFSGMPKQSRTAIQAAHRYTSKGFIPSVTQSLSKKNPTTLKKANKVRSFEKVTVTLSRLQPKLPRCAVRQNYKLQQEAGVRGVGCGEWAQEQVNLQIKSTVANGRIFLFSIVSRN